MTDFITTGIVLGLSAGSAPGPLLTLVISETLRHDISAGIRVAVSPIFTDLPIIILTLAVLSQLSGFHNILGIISLIGGCVILFMGYESMNPKSSESDLSETEPKSLIKGILANALSLHPYLFWFKCRRADHEQSNESEHGCPFRFYRQFLHFADRLKNFTGCIGRQIKIFSERLFVFILNAFIGSGIMHSVTSAFPRRLLKLLEIITF